MITWSGSWGECMPDNIYIILKAVQAYKGSFVKSGAFLKSVIQVYEEITPEVYQDHYYTEIFPECVRMLVQMSPTFQLFLEVGEPSISKKIKRN